VYLLDEKISYAVRRAFEMKYLGAVGLLRVGATLAQNNLKSDRFPDQCV
jgi:hypothetical protein